MSPDPNAFSAVEAARKIRDGILTSVDLVKACLARIDQTDGQLKAWAHLNPEHALKQAEELDAIRQAGQPMGALHGVPVGLKDIIDTSDFPTERGTPVYTGRQPDHDATLVNHLREAGAVILGKTATTEFAFLHPTETRNPHNLDYAPGGSSSGSAAAVAAFHVPLAIGTQTGGSVIRPASFCGTYGFKPTRGVISRQGVLRTSTTLDHVGVFARTLEDVALLTDAIAGYDPRDPSSYPRARPNMLAGSRADVPVEPQFAYFDLPFNDRLTESAREGVDEMVEALGGQVERLPISDNMVGLTDIHQTIQNYELCRHLEVEYNQHRDLLSEEVQSVIEKGRKISLDEYTEACDIQLSAAAYFKEFFADYDAIIAPSAVGEAPKFGMGTGDPIFCIIWTLCGLPSLNLPLLVGEHDLPIGVQLIGASEEDDRLMRTANWVLNELRSDTTPEPRS